MKIRLTIILTAIVLACCSSGEQTDDLTNKRLLNLIDEFSGSEWEKVLDAKDTLESLEEKSLPYLFDLLNHENKFVKLVNTADLIYPGAAEFYGHGWIIDYDLDWLTIRAGWAIEEITFQNFGFKENKITEGHLFELEMDSVAYQNYLKTGTYQFNIDPEKIKKINEVKTKAASWWTKNKQTWTRLKAVKESIVSGDTIQQMTVLSHLRSGNCIKGLDLKMYKELIEPTVKQLISSKHEDISQQASLLNQEVNDDGEYADFRTRCLEANSHND